MEKHKMDIPATKQAPVHDSGADWGHWASTVSAYKGAWEEWGKGSVAAPTTADTEVLTALRMQQRLINLCSEFFAEQDESDDDDEDDDGESGDDAGEDDYEKREDCKFFLRLFVENVELREHYEKNYETGEFCCLVCCGMGGRQSFKGCWRLLQHSITVSKMKVRAHRVFGHVVCEVLGWDFDRLPAIVSTGKPLRLSLVNSEELKFKPRVNADCEKIEFDVSASFAGLGIGENAGELKNGDNAEFVVGGASKPHQNSAGTLVPKVEEEENTDNDKTELVAEQRRIVSFDEKELDAGARNEDLSSGIFDELSASLASSNLGQGT